MKIIKNKRYLKNKKIMLKSGYCKKLNEIFYLKNNKITNF